MHETLSASRLHPTLGSYRPSNSRCRWDVTGIVVTAAAAAGADAVHGPAGRAIAVKCPYNALILAVPGAAWIHNSRDCRAVLSLLISCAVALVGLVHQSAGRRWERGGMMASSK